MKYIVKNYSDRILFAHLCNYNQWQVSNWSSIVLMLYGHLISSINVAFLMPDKLFYAPISYKLIV